MKFKNVSPQGELEIPQLRRVVELGEIIDVTAEEAEGLAGQVTVWEAADAEAEAVHKAAIDALDPDFVQSGKTAKKPSTRKPAAGKATAAKTAGKDLSFAADGVAETAATAEQDEEQN